MATETDAFTDIANAILRLSMTFKRHGLSAPASIELGNRDDIAKIKSMTSRDCFMAQPTFARDKPEVAASLAGIDLIAPAQFRARKGGGFDVE